MQRNFFLVIQFKTKFAYENSKKVILNKEKRRNKRKKMLVEKQNEIRKEREIKIGKEIAEKEE